MLVRLLLLCFSCFHGVIGCNEPTAQIVVDVRIVDGDNGNPVANTDTEILDIDIQEGDLEPRRSTFPVTNESFNAAIEFQLYSQLTRLRVELRGESDTLLSAPPVFVPANSGSFVRLVATPPESCELVSFNVTEVPRARFGMALSGSFALLAGGTSVAETQVEFFDALQWFSNTRTLDADNMELEETPLGDTRVAAIDETQILVLPSDAVAFVFDMADRSDRRIAVGLHSGAGPRSALVSVPDVGAMVIGGEVRGEPQSAITIVGRDGELTSKELREPRSGSTATALGSDVLVTGGNEAGNAEVLLEERNIGDLVPSWIDGVREGGSLVGDGATRALLVGGVDDMGRLRQDTVEFDSCPDACVTTQGPAWIDARLEVLQPDKTTLLIGGAGSRLVEEVRWADGAVAIAPVTELRVARAGAGAVVLESGAFIVAGGDDGSSIRDDFEFCVPAALSALSGP